MNIMSSYKKRFYQLKLLIDQLSERDRILLVVAVLLVSISFWFFLLYKPMNKLRVQVVQKSEQMKKSTEEFTSKTLIIDSVLKSPNTPGLLAQHQELKNKMHELDAQFARYNERFISKKDLSKLLHDMLKQTMELIIEDFSTVTQVAIAPPPQNTQNNNTAQPTTPPVPSPAMKSTQYRLVLKGSYFQVMNYLQSVEQLHWNLYWDKLDYKVTAYPEAIATIEFFTLKPENERPVASTPGVKP